MNYMTMKYRCPFPRKNTIITPIIESKLRVTHTIYVNMTGLFSYVYIGANYFI